MPADFEAGPVQGVLGAAGFDWAQPTLFCWTDVAPYLTAPAIESTLRTIAASAGEPVQPGWPASEIERLISRCGLKVVDHPARADLQQRYFAGRTDGLRPSTFETLVAARVA